MATITVRVEAARIATDQGEFYVDVQYDDVAKTFGKVTAGGKQKDNKK